MLLFSFSLQVCSSGDTWRADSVECTLPRALIPSSLHFLTCTCVYGTYLCVQQTPEDIWGVTKGARHNVIRQKREVLSWDAWTESYLLKKKRRRWSLSPLLVFSFFLLLSLLLTVFDCIRQVNEKQRWRSDWQPAPAKVYVCVHIPASAYVWPSRVLRQPVNTMMRQ